MKDSRISHVYKRLTPTGNTQWLVLFNNGEQVFILRKTYRTPYYQWLWATPWGEEETTNQKWGVCFNKIKTYHGESIPPAVIEAFERIRNKTL